MGDGLSVVVFGSTGTAGSGVIEACLAQPRVARVVAFSRRPLHANVTGSDKVVEVICEDFGDLAAHGQVLTGIDACFFCLGVSAMQVPEEADYRRITQDYALEAATRLLEHSPRHSFHFLSGAGAGRKARAMWARVKAETEDELGTLGLRALVCWRPGYIHPTRSKGIARLLGGAAYGGARAFKLATTGQELGRAMLRATFDGMTEGLLHNRDVMRLATGP